MGGERRAAGPGAAGTGGASERRRLVPHRRRAREPLHRDRRPSRRRRVDRRQLRSRSSSTASSTSVRCTPRSVRDPRRRHRALHRARGQRRCQAAALRRLRDRRACSPTRRSAAWRCAGWSGARTRSCYHEAENLLFSRAVNDAGGRCCSTSASGAAGATTRRSWSCAGPTTPPHDVAFVGGMDLAHGRRDDADHLGDPQAADLNEDELRPDAALARRPDADRGPGRRRRRVHVPRTVGGPDATRPPHARASHCSTAPRSIRASRASFRPSVPRHPTTGACAIQVLRTYPARRTPYPFAPEGERSIARAYIKCFRRASRLVYLEDQYLWSFRAADELCAALRREPDLLVVIVIPRYPDPDGRLAGTASALGREEVQRALLRRRRRARRRLRPRERLTARRSTCTRRCASSTTSGVRSVPTT